MIWLILVCGLIIWGWIWGIKHADDHPGVTYYTDDEGYTCVKLNKKFPS